MRPVTVPLEQPPSLPAQIQNSSLITDTDNRLTVQQTFHYLPCLVDGHGNLNEPCQAYLPLTPYDFPSPCRLTSAALDPALRGVPVQLLRLRIPSHDLLLGGVEVLQEEVSGHQALALHLDFPPLADVEAFALQGPAEDTDN